MILPDREIKGLLAKKLIAIDPAPKADAYASTSVDLTPLARRNPPFAARGGLRLR
jgi:hypothetical protein